MWKKLYIKKDIETGKPYNINPNAQGYILEESIKNLSKHCYDCDELWRLFEE